MTTTTLPRTMWATQPYRPPQPARPAIGTSWSTLAIVLAEPPVAGEWWVAGIVTADTDTGVEGQIRLRSSNGEQSEVAEIGGYAERVLIGWTEIATLDMLIYIEGRRSVSGPGGGVRLISTEVTLMIDPPATQRNTIIYPPGYIPPLGPPYPPLYSTDPQYG